MIFVFINLDIKNKLINQNLNNNATFEKVAWNMAPFIGQLYTHKLDGTTRYYLVFMK